MSGMLPDADCIIHAGDFCNNGTYKDCVRFFGWFNTLNYKHRICIAGNHDVWLENCNPSELRGILPPDVIYLNDSGCEVEGFKFWGSPVTPRFMNWAFNRDRGEDIKKHWDLIPANTDILITHGPSFGLVDECPNFDDPRGELVHVGCKDLAEKIKQINPKLHVCGHVHYGYGHQYLRDTLYVNASICNEEYSPLNKPLVVDIFPTGANIVHVL